MTARTAGTALTSETAQTAGTALASETARASGPSPISGSSDDARGGTPVDLPWHGAAGNHCFGCAANNPAGLGLRLQTSGDVVFCDFTLTRLHESYPGIVHGGVAAALLDEVMGSLLVHRERKVCFTTSLRTTFAGALRVGEPYHAVAWLAERSAQAPADPARLYKVHGEIRDAAGAALVIARGTFQWITAETYARTVAGGDPSPEIAALLRDHA